MHLVYLLLQMKSWRSVILTGTAQVTGINLMYDELVVGFLVFQFFSSHIFFVFLIYFNLFQVKKGNSIGQFLELARRQIADQFSELRTLDAGNLIYVKEDLIIPHVCLLCATFLFYPELL